MSDTEIKIEKGETPGALTWSLAAGFVAWGLDLSVSYTLRLHACSAQERFLLHIVSVICIAIALSGAALGWQVYRRLPAEKNEEGPRPEDRAHFQALLGIGFSLAFTLVVLAGAVSPWIIPVCE